MAAIKYVQANTLYMAGGGSTVGATSIVLTSLTDIYGNILTMTDFGAKGYGTCEPDTSNEEAFTFTGVTANANGTYTLTGVKTVLAKSPYTETSQLIRQHAGGTKVIITDNVAFWNTFGNINNDTTVDGQWTFTNTPIVPGTVSDASTTVKGVAQISVAPVSAGTPISVGTNDPRVPVAYAVDAVGTDAYAITPSPAITAYAAGQHFTFQAGTANTGACSLNVSGLGAKAIKKKVSLDLNTGDILLNQIVQVIYDGTYMQIVSFRPSLTSGVGVGSDTNSMPFTAAHSMGTTPTILSVVLMGTGNASLAIQNGIGMARLDDGSSPGVGALVLGTTAGNYHIITVTVDATNVTFSKSTTGTPGNIAFIGGVQLGIY